MTTRERLSVRRGRNAARCPQEFRIEGPAGHEDVSRLERREQEREGEREPEQRKQPKESERDEGLLLVRAGREQITEYYDRLQGVGDVPQRSEQKRERRSWDGDGGCLCPEEQLGTRVKYK